MQVPHNSFVVVADGQKMLLFRNEGDAEYPQLIVERNREQDNPPDADQKSDLAGRGHGPGPGSDSFEETDYHQMGKDRFAAETADLLKRWALRNAFESLIVVAPPKTLGELRKHYHKEVEKRVVGEVPKDLTGHTVQDIEQILLAI